MGCLFAVSVPATPSSGELRFLVKWTSEIGKRCWATDMRKGFDGLYGLVRVRLLCEPMSGHLFLFANAKRNRLKILYWDGSGLWCCGKRLERGCFSWPSVASPAETKVLLSQEQLALLLGGIDLSRTRRKAWYRREEGTDDRKAA